MASARRAMRDIIRHNLSKYNHAPDAPEWIWGDVPAPRVLVLDQTVGDASVTLGGASEAAFRTMLEAALAAYPLAHVWIKTHPDVIAGKNAAIWPTMPQVAASGSLPRTARRSPCWPGRMWSIPSPHRWALKLSCSARRCIASACRFTPVGD